MIMTDTVVGKVRSIGVSNFSQKNLEEILLTAEIFPAVNQVNFYFGFDVHSFIKSEQLEVHAYNPEHRLVEYSKSKGIVVQAYSPLGSAESPILTDDYVVRIAQKHSISSADVLLGYLSMFNLYCIFECLESPIVLSYCSCKRPCGATQISHTIPYRV